MALTPLGVSLSTKYTLTGPDGTIATFNDPTDANFVGYITEPSGLDSPEVRDNGENLAGQDGGAHGPFYYGRRPITISGKMINLVSATDREEKITKLRQASNAMRADATLTWTPPGGEAVYVEVRRQQPLRITGDWEKQFQLMVVSADPRIYATATSTSTITFAESEVLTAGGTKQLAGAASPDGKFIYIPNSTSNNLTIYSRNAETGTLTKVENQATGTAPYNITISPDGKHLYVVNKSANTISKFSRNEATGKLTAVGVAIATGSEPMKAAMTADGKFLYVPNKAGNTIGVYERNSGTGELTLKETFTLPIAASGPTVTLSLENANPEAGFPLVAVGCYTTSKVIILRRNTSTGALSNEAGVPESQRILKASETLGGEPFAEKIVDMKVDTSVEHSGEVYASRHWILVSGENGVMGAIAGRTGKSGAFELKGEFSYSYTAGGLSYGSFEAAAKPTFIEDTHTYTIALPGVGKVSLFETYSNRQLANLGAAAVGNVGKPIAVFRSAFTYDVYVPAADKIFEYRFVYGSANVQKFQNKAAFGACVNKGSMETFPKITLTMAAGQELINPTFVNEATGEALTFAYTFKENDSLEVNMNNRTVTLNKLNSFFTVNLSGTSWWALGPGTTNILVSAEKVVGAPKAVITWHSAWV